MRLKIRCDGECEKFYKIFWELNKALVIPGPLVAKRVLRPGSLDAEKMLVSLGPDSFRAVEHGRIHAPR